MMEMKKDFFKVLLLGVFTAFMTACGDDEPSDLIWDFGLKPKVRCIC